MPTKPVPPEYHSVTPYLPVGDAERELKFMKTAFGARETHRTNAPNGRIWHAEVQIGDSRVMIGQVADPSKVRQGTLYLYVENVDEIYKKALGAGGKILRSPSDEFYGDRSAGVIDPAGTHWWIATHKEDISDQELQERILAEMEG